jgi:Rrf2 family protein
VATMVLPTLPKAVEYAIKVLTCLAVSAGRAVSASEAARCVRIPPSQAAKTLHFLSWAGLTRSRRGPKGGYLLGKRPEEIRLEQVMRLYQPAAQQEVEGPADPILQVWSETSGSGEQAWEQLTIAELARRTAGQWQSSMCAEEAASLRKTKKSKEEFPGAHS